MIADIFYPIFTLTITILACCIRKKKQSCSGICIHAFTKALPWAPWGLKAPPRPPASIVFGFAKNRCAHTFSVLSPGKVRALDNLLGGYCIYQFQTAKRNLLR